MGFDFLFAQPTFTRGFSRSIDFWGMADVYNVSDSSETADAMAMWADWKDVGTDLVEAVQHLTLPETAKAA
jgi:hypothetical protein